MDNWRVGAEMIPMPSRSELELRVFGIVVHGLFIAVGGEKIFLVCALNVSPATVDPRQCNGYSP